MPCSGNISTAESIASSGTPSDAGELMSSDLSAIETVEQYRAAISGVQDAMVSGIQSGDFVEADCPVDHFFAPGLYARQILIPAGSVVIGKIHKHQHLNIISKGIALVSTEFGYQEYNAYDYPVTFVSDVGTKRVVKALTDVVWTTFHPTEEKELAKIEEHVIAKSYDELNRLTYTDVKGLIQ